MTRRNIGRCFLSRHRTRLRQDAIWSYYSKQKQNVVASARGAAAERHRYRKVFKHLILFCPKFRLVVNYSCNHSDNLFCNSRICGHYVRHITLPDLSFPFSNTLLSTTTCPEEKLGPHRRQRVPHPAQAKSHQQPTMTFDFLKRQLDVAPFFSIPHRDCINAPLFSIHKFCPFVSTRVCVLYK